MTNIHLVPQRVDDAKWYANTLIAFNCSWLTMFWNHTNIDIVECFVVFCWQPSSWLHFSLKNKFTRDNRVNKQRRQTCSFQSNIRGTLINFVESNSIKINFFFHIVACAWNWTIDMYIYDLFIFAKFQNWLKIRMWLVLIYAV